MKGSVPVLTPADAEHGIHQPSSEKWVPAHREVKILVLCSSQPALSLCHFLLEQ